MTKSQLIERITQQAPHVHPRRIEAIVNAVFEQMTEALKAGERIELRGFGCFVVKSRPARLGRNPRTGASVAVPRRIALAFAAGKELRERINRAPLPDASAPSALPCLPPASKRAPAERTPHPSP
jgi:integration host factor subunit beta